LSLFSQSHRDAKKKKKKKKKRRKEGEKERSIRRLRGFSPTFKGLSWLEKLILRLRLRSYLYKRALNFVARPEDGFAFS